MPRSNVSKKPVPKNRKAAKRSNTASSGGKSGRPRTSAARKSSPARKSKSGAKPKIKKASTDNHRVKTAEYERIIRDELIYADKRGLSSDAAAIRIWAALSKFAEEQLLDGRTVAIKNVFSVQPCIRQASKYKDIHSGKIKTTPERRSLRLVVPYDFKQRVKRTG